MRRKEDELLVWDRVQWLCVTKCLCTCHHSLLHSGSSGYTVPIMCYWPLFCPGGQVTFWSWPQYNGFKCKCTFFLNHHKGDYYNIEEFLAIKTEWILQIINNSYPSAFLFSPHWRVVTFLHTCLFWSRASLALYSWHVHKYMLWFPAAMADLFYVVHSCFSCFKNTEWERCGGGI